MCFSAIPGQNDGIRAVHFARLALSQKLAVNLTAPNTVPRRRYSGTVLVSSSRREPTSWDWLSDFECRRYRRTDHERGKRQRKSTHKPRWRGYEKY